MFALILCSIKHTFIHRTMRNTIANHSEFPVRFNAATVTTHSKFLNDKINQEFQAEYLSFVLQKRTVFQNNMHSVSY